MTRESRLGIEMELFRCRTCERMLERTDYWTNTSAKSGLQTECKPCMRKRNQAWHESHRDQIRERQRASTRKHRVLNPRSMFLRSIRWRAKAQGMVCTLTIDDLVIPEFCPVLGMRLTFGMGLGEGRRDGAADSRASVDRLDSSKGYTPDNIVIVSWRANRIKSDATAAELKALAEFYNDHERVGSAQRKGNPVEVLRSGGAPDDVPGMLVPQKKEARSLLVGENR